MRPSMVTEVRGNPSPLAAADEALQGHRWQEAFDLLSRADAEEPLSVDDSTLLGLLCLKASGLGFCSADDVRNRRHATAAPTSAADVDGA